MNTNNELINLAKEVLRAYDIKPSNLSIVQSGGIKTVWKFEYNGRPFCLKRLKQTLDKAMFSVYAQKYVKDLNGNVPGIIPGKNNELIMKYNDELFVVYEWVEGKDLNFSNRNDLSNALEGLAEFHLKSKGYKCPEGARISSKVGKWPSQYESMKAKLVAWKEVARGKSGQENETYLYCADNIINIANTAIKALEKSKYIEYSREGSTQLVLCHQDFGKGNAIWTDRGVVVLDLDGVTFDLPSRDLRKIIGKLAENSGRWNINQINDILYWYTSINPFTNDEKKVLYIDLLFPHWFFGLVKNQYINLKTLKSSEIEKITRLEISKIPIIEELLMR